MEPHLMLYACVLSYPVVGDVILHVIDNFSGVTLHLMVLVLLCLNLRPVLATAPGMHQLLVEVVVVVLIEVSVRHDGGVAHNKEIRTMRAGVTPFPFASTGVMAHGTCAHVFKGLPQPLNLLLIGRYVV